MPEPQDALTIGRNTDGKLVRRPLSPHLQIYKPQITTVLSICHRATGIALSFGTLLLVWWLVAAATSPDAFSVVQNFIGSPFGWLIMFGWTAALYYHLFAGIRHLAWDAGYGFQKHEYHLSGKIVVAATVICTIITWIVGAIIH